MIRVVVFDFDGTLVDSNGIKEACLYKTVDGLEGGAGLISEVSKQGGDRFAIFDEFARRYYGTAQPQNVPVKSRMLARRYGDFCLRGIASAAERRGARHALTTLHRRGVRLWILSATPAEPLQDALHRRGLYRWLRGAVGGPVSKTEGLRLILQHERVQRNELLMVGDGFDDEEAARGMKIRFAGITLERRLPVRGRFALRDLYRLPSLVEEFGGRARRTSRRS